MAIGAGGYGAIAGALLGAANAKKLRKEALRKRRLAASMARWSPFTGNQNWQSLATTPMPTALGQAIAGASKGYGMGKSIGGAFGGGEEAAPAGVGEQAMTDVTGTHNPKLSQGAKILEALNHLSVGGLPGTEAGGLFY